MALSNYTELKAAVADWLDRTDLTTQIVDGIALAEAPILRDLKLRVGETTATGTTATATIAIPAGLGKIERLEIVSSGVSYTLNYTSPNGIELLTYSTGLPTRYTVENGAIRLIPAPASTYTYTLYYVPNLAVLSASNPTNWVLTNAPDVYLFGSLVQVALFTMDDAAAARFGPLFGNAMDAVRRMDYSKRFPLSGGLQIKPRHAR